MSYPLAERTKETMENLLMWQGHIEASIAICGGGFSFEDVTRQVLAGALHAYFTPEYCILMELNQLPLKKVYHCVIACGNMEAILAQQPRFVEIANQLGADELTLAGRRGWERAFATQGWKLDYVVLSLKLEKASDE